MAFLLLLWALSFDIGARPVLMYIAAGESLSPSPLALQKVFLLFEVLCVRYVALRSGSVPYTAMLLRLSRPYSYDPRPLAKKL